MNYSEFKDHIVIFLWKQNDSDLIARLDSLGQMANSELNTKFDVQRRDQSIGLLANTVDINLPVDFRHMQSVTPASVYFDRPLKQSIPSHVSGLRTFPGLELQRNAFYATKRVAQQPVLMLPAVSSGLLLNVHYRTNVPDFAITNTSWVCDEFLDLYTYTVLSHTATFLREDERLQVWGKLKTDALTAALMEDRHNVQFGGSPLHMQPHHPVP